MVQAVNLIDCDHRDDLNEHVNACREQVHQRVARDPHMDDSI